MVYREQPDGRESGSRPEYVLLLLLLLLLLPLPLPRLPAKQSIHFAADRLPRSSLLGFNAVAFDLFPF